MSDDNVINFIPKIVPKTEDEVYNRIYSCLEAAYLQEPHNCTYCKQNNLVSQMIFEILINELVSVSKKTKLQFSTFDAKMILNGISERIVTLEQAMVAKQEAGTPREGQLRGLKRSDQDVEETSITTEEVNRETSKDSVSDREEQE